MGGEVGRHYVIEESNDMAIWRYVDMVCGDTICCMAICCMAIWCMAIWWLGGQKGTA